VKKYWGVFLVISFCLVTAVVTNVTAQVNVKEPVTDSRKMSEPDISVLKNIDADLLTACQSRMSCGDIDTGEINTQVYKIIKALASENYVLKATGFKIVNDVTDLHKEIASRDIRVRKKQILKSVNKMIQRLEDFLDKTDDAIICNQKSVGKLYCKTNQSAKRCYDNLQISKKRSKAFGLIVEIDSYFTEVERVSSKVKELIALLDAMRNNIISYVDTECQSRLVECKYNSPVDIRVANVRLSGSLWQMMSSFGDVVELAQRNFVQ
jgi:hypothetical protein